MNKERDDKVDQIFDLYTKFGSDDYIGEPVSQIEHMSQAAQLAMRAGTDEEVILAAFFHDIGHLISANEPENSMGGYGARNHEQLGSHFLAQAGFSAKVCSLIENHVEAKRYLTLRRPGYHDKLSVASKKTLEYQGGRMSEQEADNFESDPLFEMHIKLREWDEAAKEEHVPVLDLEELKIMAKRVINRNIYPSRSL